jgi:PAS domain S-box-containing protein
MKSSLQGLLLGLTSAALVVVTLGGLAINLHREVDEAKLRLAEQTRRLASAAVPVLLNTLVVGDLASAEETLRRINEEAAWSKIRIYEEDERQVIIDASPKEPATLTAPAWFQRLLPVELPEVRLPIEASPVVYGVLAVRPSAKNLVNELWRQTQVTVIVNVVLLGTLLILMQAILAYGLRPVRALGASAARLGRGDLNARMPETRLSDVAPTVRAFNTMANNLQQAMDALQAQGLANRRLAAGVEQSADAIVTVDLEERVTAWNLGARNLFGRRDDEMLGQPIGVALAQSPQEAQEKTARLLSTRSPQRVEMTVTTPAGSLRWLSASCSPLHAEDGAAMGHIIVVRDISARKQAEGELRQAKEQAEAGHRAKAEFLAVMSHEIRTPMNGIMGMTELLLQADLTPEQQEALGIIKLSADSLLQIIDTILDFSRLEAERLELESVPFPVQAVISHTLRTFVVRAHEKGLELAVTIGPEVPDSVVGDPGRLRQILMNLVGNALKFTERGEIVVRVTAAPTAGGVDLQVAVSDTGVGIPAEKIETIFDVFTQVDSSTNRRYGGTGLGLAIAKRLVTLMRGRMWVESAEGRGSTFFFNVPASVAAPATGPARDPARLQGLRALVVDDNATAARIVRDILVEAGVRPLTIEGGEAGWMALLRAQAHGELPAILITDHHMPVVDGFDLVRRLKADPALAHLAVVMLSSSGLPADARRARDMGVGAFLVKPVTRSDLVAAIVDVAAAAEMPARPAPSLPAVPAAAAPAESGRRLRVLLAEDNAINQKVVLRMLERLGHQVVVADSGRAALAALDAHPVDLVLMDVEIPDLNGLEVTAAIRATEAATRAGACEPGPTSTYAAHLGRRIPIVALTAHAMRESAERCLAAGMDAFLAKPFKGTELATLMTRLTGDIADREITPGVRARE